MPLDSNNYGGAPPESPDPGMHITEGCLMTEISELSLEREKRSVSKQRKEDGYSRGDDMSKGLEASRRRSG